MTKPFASLEEEVYLEIRRTSEVVARWAVETLKPSRLTPSQFNVLRILRGARPASMSSREISERMVTHDSDLTRLLDRLEGSGWISKSRDERDRRVVNVRITNAGLKVVEEASSAVRARLQSTLGPLGPRKLGTLADLLERVRQAGG